MAETDYRVKLRSRINRYNSVTFEATPDVVENRNVNYRSLDPVHMPGNFQVYQNTSSRTFSVNNVRLISRTIEEATRNYRRLNILRAWAMPFFGRGTASDEFYETSRTKVNTQGQEHDLSGIPQDERYLLQVRTPHRGKIGAPPEVIEFSAYASKGKRHGSINRVPVVLQQISIPYPSDTDYIPTQDGVPFPTIMTIDMQLLEIHSADEYRNFSLNDYRNGRMRHF